MGDPEKDRADCPAEAGPAASFLDALLELKLEGPADWSENLDQYLNEEHISTHE